MQGSFGIYMLAGMNRVRRPTGADGVLHLLSRVVVPADKLEAVDDLDRVELLTDVIPELGEIGQECRNEVRITKIGDVCQLIASWASGITKPR
jgi:hypothetical protein